MKICDKFHQGRPIYSFEIFPPKPDSPIETIYKVLDEMEGLAPDFISVTFGASGNTPGNSRTFEIASLIKERYHIEAMMHLTCINYSRSEVAETVAMMEASGVENVLALRGDINPSLPLKNDFRHADDLVAYIRAHSTLGVSGACYPEGHIECRDLVADIRHLKKKVDAGCEHLVSQLFFDNELFFAFLTRARCADINVPIEAGVMPVTNISQVKRMVEMCGASIPAKLQRLLDRWENNPAALYEAGIAYAIDQIVDLVAGGAQGIHLYTMNSGRTARRITDAVLPLFR